MLRKTTLHVCLSGLAASALLCFATTPCAAGEDQPANHVMVVIRNYVGVSPQTLHVAQARALGVFAKAGVTIDWWELPGTTGGSALSEARECPEGPGACVYLIPESMAARLRPSRDALGWALANRVIYVFVDRARKYVNRWRGLNSFPNALGHIIAHEIGHVLLGENSHAPESIMTPKLGPPEFLQMDWGQLLFTPAQAQRMLDRLGAQQQATQTAVLLAQN